MIHIRDLTYHYPNSAIAALTNLDLQICEGEFVLLAGPSGAGKSTLLRTLNGLIPHFSGGRISGEIILDQHDVIALGPKFMSTQVGFVFQDPESQNILDIVEDELAYGLENAAVHPDQIGERITESLSSLDISDLRHRPINTLSGGERQKIAIASVLVLRPRVLVLDEPTSQLDPQAAGDLLRLLAKLNAEQKMTIILVEQRLERVARYASRLIYLEKGSITLDEPVRSGLAHLDLGAAPPLARLWRSMHWNSMPLTTEEGIEQGVLERTRRSESKSQSRSTAIPSFESAITVLNLKYAYGDTEVLKGVSFDIRVGEAAALVGRNGSGKTTLLKCLVGLLQPARGEIELGGTSIAGKNVAEICRDTAFLPQNPDDLLFADSVLDELHSTLHNHEMLPEKLFRSPLELLSILGLEQLSQAYPRDLSVGQRQRTGLGAVLVTEPKVVLLDEPTRGLDYQAKRDLIQLWRQWREDGVTLLLVTHDVELVARACDRVLVLDDGVIEADGPVADILEQHPVFKPQLSRLFGGYGWLTVNDVLSGINQEDA